MRAFVALLLNGGELAVVALAGTLLVRGRAIGSTPLWIRRAARGRARRLWRVLVRVSASAGGAGCVSAVSFGAALFIVSRKLERCERILIRLAAPWALGTTLFVFRGHRAAAALSRRIDRRDRPTTIFPAMPGDNDLPRVFADLIRSGSRAHVLGGDWLTSDRPPLQTGIALLGWPPLSVLGLDFDTACATAGIWFQALWFPVVWMLLRALGLPSRATLGATAALGGTAFLVFDTVYVLAEARRRRLRGRGLPAVADAADGRSGGRFPRPAGARRRVRRMRLARAWRRDVLARCAGAVLDFRCETAARVAATGRGPAAFFSCSHCHGCSIKISTRRRATAS